MANEIDDSKRPRQHAAHGVLHSRWFLVLAVGALYAAAVFSSEKIQGGLKLGWDGALFGAWARDAVPPFSDHQIPRYYVTRSLPPLLVHRLLVLLRDPLSNPSIVRAFELTNILLVFGSAFAWTFVADRLKLSLRARWLGALVLFGNLSHLKMSAFYPVLIDEWAFTLSMIQLALFLARARLALTMTTLIGAFCWPTTLFNGAALIAALPRNRDVDSGFPGAPMPRWATLLSLLVALAWAALCTWAYPRDFISYSATEPVSLPLVLFSIFIAAAAAFAGLFPLLAQSVLPALRRIRDFVSPAQIAALALCVAVAWVQRRISVEGAFFTTEQALGIALVTSIQKPAIFVVAHAVFFGPIVLFALLRWKTVCARMARFGPGIPLLMTIGVLLLLNSESRRSSDLFAFVAPFAIQALDDERLSTRSLVGFAAFTLFFSKVWMTFDVGVVGPAPSEFPAQLYFMNQGPWMSWSMYAVQGAAVLGAALWLRHVLPRAAPEPEFESEPDAEPQGAEPDAAAAR